MGTDSSSLLKVSVIVPCLNEAATIQILLNAIYRQTYPLEQIEVIISDGMSTDSTRQKIEAFSQAHPELKIHIVDNPERSIPAALNKAIRASNGEIIIRLDAHSMPYPDYIERIVTAIKMEKGDNVGGVWEIQPGKNKDGKVTWMARSIAAAASNPLGVGNALYRYTQSAQTVDTVPFGAFRKRLIEKVGYFNERLLTNEDYEFNVRITKLGGVIWLDPAIRSVYFARPTYSALLKQYWRYGFWKAQMLKDHPKSIRWRQALPPAFVLSMLLLFVLGLWISSFWVLLLTAISFYTLSLLVAGTSESIRKKDGMMVIGVPIAILCMHLSWGTAFWYSLISTWLKPTPQP